MKIDIGLLRALGASWCRGERPLSSYAFVGCKEPHSAARARNVDVVAATARNSHRGDILQVGLDLTFVP